MKTNIILLLTLFVSCTSHQNKKITYHPTIDDNIIICYNDSILILSTKGSIYSDTLFIRNGNVYESVWFEKLDGTPVKMFEKNASIIENRIRFENSLPQRAFYYSVGGKGFMPSQLPIFYNNQFINRLR